MSFVRTVPERELREKRRLLFRHHRRQIALFSEGGGIYAVDNRCPHEGYPLLQGTVDPEERLLTCQWHNWKFELSTGECVLGEDHVRSYPTRVADGIVEIDVSDPPLEEVRSRILRGLEGALGERQYGRIARELSRLLVHGIDPLAAVERAIELSHDRFELGFTHAYAACADWLELYEDEEGLEQRVVCLSEALDHIAHDALRQPRFPYSGDLLEFDPGELLRAVEREAEQEAVSRVRGALAAGLEWGALEPVLAAAALAHYNDFGHAAIYVQKAGALLEKLPGLDPHLVLLPLIRKLCYSTREDLLPEFAPYREAAARGPLACGTGSSLGEGARLSGLNIREAVRWTEESLSREEPGSVHSALLEAAAVNLLRFEERLDAASRRTASQNVGWLDFTHAITFASAVRDLSRGAPELWARGLLQMACFVGRNKRFLGAERDLASFEASDPRLYLRGLRERLFDHGLSDPIFSAHLLKTLVAAEKELPLVSESCARHLAAAVSRFFSARIKEKHPLRTARQALALVSTASGPGGEGS